MQTVGILGGAGFIASYVTQKFLSEGYAVKVSASDPANAKKYAHLGTLNRAENLMLVPCNVRDVAALESFMQGCAIVVHGGIPFQLAVEYPQRDLLDPTIRGTENFLAIANRTEGLKSVVFFASVASYTTSFPMPHPNHPAGQDFPKLIRPGSVRKTIPTDKPSFWPTRSYGNSSRQTRIYPSRSLPFRPFLSLAPACRPAPIQRRWVCSTCLKTKSPPTHSSRCCLPTI